MAVVVCHRCGFSKIYPAEDVPEGCPSCGFGDLSVSVFKGWDSSLNDRRPRKFGKPSFRKRRVAVPILKVDEGRFLLNLPLLFEADPAPIAELGSGEFELIT